jgi:WD40 repeat protein
MSDANLIAVVKDSERFVLRFFDAIELSASHIYESALPLSPSSSLVRARYLNQELMNVHFSDIDDVWDACIRTIRPQSHVYSAVFSHKDDLVAIGEAGVVEIFEAATGQRRATLMTNYRATSLSFSPDDNILVSGDWSKVDVWDLHTGGHIGTVERHTAGINSIEFSPCGNMIATCSDDYTIQIWNPFSLDCKCLMEGHSRQVRDVCWLDSGSKVISGSLDKTIKVWSISDQQCSQTFTIPTGDSVYSVASSPDSTLIAAGSNDGVKVFDAETGEVLHIILMNIGDINSILFLNRDQIMCLATGDGNFRIWDLKESVEVLTFKYKGSGHAMSSDGTRIVSSRSDVVNIWQTDMPIQNQDVAQDTPIQNKHHRTKPMKMLKKIKSSFTFPHRKNLATISQSESQATFRHTDEVSCITFSNDGRLVASGSWDKTAKVWDTSTGQCSTTFRGHLDRVYGVKFSPDSKLCASWGCNDVTRIWNVSTGNQVSTFEQQDVDCACFSFDGTQLVSISESEVKLLDVTTGDCLASMQVQDEFTDISFGVDGSSIIMRGDSDAKIQIWTLSSAHNFNQTDNSTTPLPRMPMVFLPVHDTVPPIFPDASPPQYHNDQKSSWVLDSQKRRMLWIPPDSQSYCHGEKVALGSRSGRVMMVYFQNVRTTQLH